jgi:hypothetical protein
LEGSDYIASEFALQTILKLIRSLMFQYSRVGTLLALFLIPVFKFTKNSDLTIDYIWNEKRMILFKVLSKNVEIIKIHLFSELNKIRE